jgi:hypothetical protein
MSHVHCIELKIYQDETGILTEKQVLSEIQSYIEKGKRSEKLVISPKVSLKGLTTAIELLGHKVINGISGGCTVWLDALQFPSRFIDDNGDETVNLFGLISDADGEFIWGMDGDMFVELIEDLGFNVSRNNTYNYGGNEETPFFLVNADFSIISNDEKGKAFLVIKFHCGGDIRGNYTDTVVYRFESIDDIYTVVFPFNTNFTEGASK